MTVPEFFMNVSSICQDYLATPRGTVWRLFRNITYWEDAFDVCNVFGGYLARIYNQADFDGMIKFKNSGTFWIGVKMISSVPRWYITQNESENTQLTWWAGPIGTTNDPHCFAFNSMFRYLYNCKYLMYNDSCAQSNGTMTTCTSIPHKLPFVCEIPNPSESNF